MSKTPINPWTWQDRRGFTQAWRVEAPAAILFVSGQVPLDDDGNLVAPGDFDGQARRTLPRGPGWLRAPLPLGPLRGLLRTLHIPNAGAVLAPLVNRVSPAGSGLRG